MDEKTVAQIFEDTAYVRMGGSPEELKAAQYLVARCACFGCEAVLESFPVSMTTTKEARLVVDGKPIPCVGYLCAGSGEVEAPLYYLRNYSPFTLSQYKGKIILFDGTPGYWGYQDFLEQGVLGFITYAGNANFADRDIDQRELYPYVSQGKPLPGVNIHVKDAIELIRSGAQTASIKLVQDTYTADSHNVILDLPGQIPQYIVLSAHYDSVSLSQGIYDNMSGAAGLLYLAEAYAKKPHRYGLRFIWCGSEERGLLGAKAYCEAHADALKDIALCINLDMIGSIMGRFIACCTAEEKLVSYIQYFASEQGFDCHAYQDMYSSDSTAFADKGVPALSFARIAPDNTASIHSRYDTAAVMSTRQMLEDCEFIAAFLDRMCNAALCPVDRNIPDNMKEKLDGWTRKRPKNT